MVMTAFLSMWLSNTATTAMMLPIAISVIKELGQCTDPPPQDETVDHTQESESQFNDETPGTNTEDDLAYQNYDTPQLPTRIPLSGDGDDRLTVPLVERNVRLTVPYVRKENEANGVMKREPRWTTGNYLLRANGGRRDHTALDMASVHQSVRGRSFVALSSNAGVDLPAELEDEGKPLSDTVVRLSKGLVIGIAFAANIGGVGTLVGTPPNLVLIGTLRK